MWWKRLKTAMDAKGMTPDELATAVNVDRGRIYDYLRGRTKNPRGEIIKDLAQALGIDHLYLMHGLSTDQTVTLRNITLLTLDQISTITPVMSLLDIDANGRSIALPVHNPEHCVAVQNTNAANLPDLSPGDILVFDTEAAIEPGKFVVAILTSESVAHIARYRPLVHNSPDEFELRFANPDYPAITINQDNPGRVLARAVMRVSHI